MASPMTSMNEADVLALYVVPLLVGVEDAKQGARDL